MRAAGSVLLALALDALFAEPPARLHPVARFGRLVAPVDRAWRFPFAVGALAAFALPLFAAAVAFAAVALADRISPLAGALAAGLVVFATTSRRMLLDAARGVIACSERDLARARRDLRALAGRDASALSSGQVRSAAVESAAENLADGLVAPLLAFCLLAPASLALGAAGAAWIKGVNTLDSMLGYRSKPVGTPSARLDDLVMWVPARTSALLLALAAGSIRSVGAARKWVDAVPSPNSGWPMGTLAAATGVRLEKPGVYTLNPDAPLPTRRTAERGLRIVSAAGLLAFAAAAGWAALAEGDA